MFYIVQSSLVELFLELEWEGQRLKLLSLWLLFLQKPVNIHINLLPAISFGFWQCKRATILARDCRCPRLMYYLPDEFVLLLVWYAMSLVMLLSSHFLSTDCSECINNVLHIFLFVEYHIYNILVLSWLQTRALALQYKACLCSFAQHCNLWQLASLCTANQFNSPQNQVNHFL